MSIPNPSKEQELILQLIADSNLIVDSVAGSGKTTLNLLIAKHYPNLNILLLTYNARLKDETRLKASHYQLTNLEIHTYHSLVVKYLNNQAYTDFELKSTLTSIETKQKKVNSYPTYDLIIIDEAQDLTPLYFELVWLFIQNSLTPVKLCIVGDKYQSIYGFQQADSRMITLANLVFDSPKKIYIKDGLQQPNWKYSQLSVSFRVPNLIANFINQVCLGYHRLDGYVESNVLPSYIICDSYGNTPYEQFINYTELGYKSSDFFIIAPSLRAAKSPIRILANRLTQAGFPIHVPVSDNDKLNDQVIQGKVVFSTFHQVKGLERKVVMIFNFDDSYFTYYARNYNQYVCSNEIYVALTRCKEQLAIFHHYNQNYLPFLNTVSLKKHANFKEYRKIKLASHDYDEHLVRTPVTDLVRHLSMDIYQKLPDFFTIRRRQSAGRKIEIPDFISTNHGTECVSEINGIAIPAYFEYSIRKKMSIYQEESLIRTTKNNCTLDNPESNGLVKKIPGIPVDLQVDQDQPLTVPKLLKIANYWNSFCSKYQFKINQIQDYRWLTKKQLDQCKDRVKLLITNTSSNQIKFEHKVELQNKHELSNRHIIGYIDLIDQQNIYEIKCTNSLQPEHYLQLAIYMYLYLSSKSNRVFETNQQSETNYQFYLYNILTDQLDQIESDLPRLTEMVKLIIRAKDSNNQALTDDAFLDQIQKIKTRIDAPNT